MPTGNASDGSGLTRDAASGVSEAAAEAAPVLPQGCVFDSAAQVTLCTTSSACPALRIDHDLYPNCGFRYPSTAIDVECVCDDSLCPLGAALDCAQAAALLDSQSELLTCIQRNEGRCAARTH